jgi:drug/metabolite transporter (DMT)-like permease
MSDSTSGLLYAFGASIALAISLAIGKSVLNQVNMIQFGFIWFSLGSFFNLSWYSFTNIRSGKFVHSKKTWETNILIAIPDAFATALFFIAIQKMENPAVVSFIGNLGPVIVTILGISILKERFGFLQIGGIILTLSGVFFLSFDKGSILQPGSEYVMLAALLFAICTIFGRSRRESLDPALMSTIRSVLLFFFFLIYILISGTRLVFPGKIWAGFATGSILETLLTIIFGYQALKYIEATKTSLIISSKALWLLGIAYVFFNVFPPIYQTVGGILTMIGIILINIK